MCGIAGIVNLSREPVSATLLQRMTDSIAHRGPDDEGQWIERYVGLGHRRLSVIDLSETGHQPMKTADSRYVITYNGEVYNFKELRSELESLGHRFFSHTDTEVVLIAYAQWKERCVEKLNGMFSFAIWDTEKCTLFLARDRYGIKPLYYTCAGNDVIMFASEQKAFLSHPRFDIRVDYEALVEYFTFQNLFTKKNFIKNVSTFPPGHYATIEYEQLVREGPHNIEKSFTQYWDFDFREPEEAADEREYIEELDRLFSRAVRRQLVSDVDVGAYLSGGMDSGSITAVAARQLPYMKTFTCGFDLSSASGLELGFDERKKAEYMSYLFKTEHYEMVLKSGDMERCMPAYTWHLETPRVGQSYPNYYAAKLAGKFVKVVLAGTGGDELFGGYPWRYYRAAVNDDFENYIDKYYTYWQRLIRNKLLHKVFAPIWDEVNHVWTRDIFRDVFKSHAQQFTRPEDYVNHSLYFEAKTFLHGLLMVEDSLSMAHGLETRVPFLDNDLVDFAMRVPVNLKVGNLKNVVRLNENEPGPKTKRYFRKTRDGKLLLRRMLSRYVPSSVSGDVKQGFSAPDAAWFKGESIEYVKDTLYCESPVYAYFDKKSVQQLSDEHLSGKVNRRLLVWSLLNFDSWLRCFTRS